MARHRERRAHGPRRLRLHGDGPIATDGWASGALDALTGWLLFAALVLTTGPVAVRWLVLPRARAGGVVLDRDALGRVLADAGFRASLLFVPALALVFARQLLEFRDPFVPWREDAELLLTGTEWGRTYLGALLLALLAPAAFALARARRAGWLSAAVVVLALGAFPALTGHANAAGDLRPLMLSADILHVWVAGAWIGGLAMVLWLDRAWLRRDTARLLPGLVPAFSPVAVGSVAVLILTGTFGAWMHLPTPSALLTSTYGRTLSLKLLLVAAVFALGFVNWRRLTPGLGHEGGSNRLASAAMVELVVAQIVLVLTAVLVRMPPP